MRDPAKRFAFALSLVLFSTSSWSDIKSSTFSFVHDNNRLVGLLDLPEDSTAKAMVVIVQGYGETDIVEGNGWYELRRFFTDLGFAVYAWDKPGCGKSEGAFDVNQPIESSAGEALAAIRELKKQGAPGSNRIGLWGISRAGWINPLIINQDPTIAFWISISGVDALENFSYLLETNLRIEGRTEEQVQMLMSEFETGAKIFRYGGSYEEFQNARKNLVRDPFWQWTAGEPTDEETFYEGQKIFLAEDHVFDEETGLEIYVQNFDEILENIDIPVLAIFGELDGNVDWRKTKRLYQQTMGNGPDARLTVVSFSNCNHNIIKSKTGGMREEISSWEPCDGYYETMSSWVDKFKLSK